MNATIRYVPAESNLLLTYANENCFAVVLYFNQDLSSKKIAAAQIWTQKLIDAALSLNGNYYLPYQNFATPQQFQKAYPNYKTFIKLKKQYDPENRFSNHLFEKYLGRVIN